MVCHPLGFTIFQKFIKFFTQKYFSCEVRNLCRIPDGPCLLVANHNAIAVFCPEVWILGSHYFENKENLQVLGHDSIFKIPIINWFAKRFLKFIPNNHQSAINALRASAHVLVYPGGSWESCRPYEQRNIIDFKNRTGFIELAIAAKVPIIPIVACGAHNGLYIWKRGSSIANFLKFSRIFRIDSFPLGFSFPFLFHLGPFFPFFPLPSKVIIEVLPAMDCEYLQKLELSQARDEVIEKMQQALDHIVEFS